MWTIVIACTETEGDVAALTRGGLAYVDIDRLITSTGANIVKDLKQHPERLGILGTQLDARIINVDMLTVLAIARTYGDTHLHALMKARGMSIAPDAKAKERLAGSELGLLLSGHTLGTRKRGQKPGDNTKAAFQSLAEIARTNDSLLNRAVGEALIENGYIEEFAIEKDLGTEYAVRSDLYVVRRSEPIRLEAMWRSKAGRADVANYVLTKLGLYSRAIGLMD
jgi:DNA (cytosine-5)-methyltransferase 1